MSTRQTKHVGILAVIAVISAASIAAILYMGPTSVAGQSSSEVAFAVEYVSVPGGLARYESELDSADRNKGNSVEDATKTKLSSGDSGWPSCLTENDIVVFGPSTWGISDIMREANKKTSCEISYKSRVIDDSNPSETWIRSYKRGSADDIVTYWHVRRSSASAPATPTPTPEPTAPADPPQDNNVDPTPTPDPRPMTDYWVTHVQVSATYSTSAVQSATKTPTNVGGVTVTLLTEADNAAILRAANRAVINHSITTGSRYIGKNGNVHNFRKGRSTYWLITAESEFFAGSASIADRTMTQNRQYSGAAFPDVASGKGTGTITYSVIGQIPYGVEFDASTRKLAGTPDEPFANRTLLYIATDGDGESDSLEFDVQVNPELRYEYRNSEAAEITLLWDWPAGTQFEDWEYKQSSGGWTKLSSPVSGDECSAGNPITCTMNNVVNNRMYTFQVRYNDHGTITALSNSISVRAQKDLIPEFPEQASIDIIEMTKGRSSSSATLPAATGGNGSLVYSAVGNLPAGIRFVPSSRRFTGTPTEELMRYSGIQYTATDADGDTVSLSADIIVKPHMPTVATISSVPAHHFTGTHAWLAWKDPVPSMTYGKNWQYSVNDTDIQGVRWHDFAAVEKAPGDYLYAKAAMLVMGQSNTLRVRYVVKDDAQMIELDSPQSGTTSVMGASGPDVEFAAPTANSINVDGGVSELSLPRTNRDADLSYSLSGFTPALPDAISVGLDSDRKITVTSSDDNVTTLAATRVTYSVHHDVTDTSDTVTFTLTATDIP